MTGPSSPFGFSVGDLKNVNGISNVFPDIFQKQQEYNYLLQGHSKQYSNVSYYPFRYMTERFLRR